LASPKWPLRRCLTSTQHFFISTDMTLYGSKDNCACILITLSWAWTCLLLLQKQHFSQCEKSRKYTTCTCRK
jgi:hypothetical protein